MSLLRNEFQRYELFVFDLDGVIWRGAHIIPKAPEAIRRLMDSGKHVYFVTNNSTRSRIQYVMRLKRAGIIVDMKHVITSGYATAIFLREKLGGGKAFVIGEKGLVEELRLQGIDVIDLEVNSDTKVDFVVVGLDREFTYRKLMLALRAILKGALFIATNEDATFPTEDGIIPGAGALVAALRCAVGRPPDYTLGKPNTWMLEIALNRANVDKSKMLVIGDRLDTDIEAAKRMGVSAALVLTGVTKASKLRSSTLQPDFVLNNLMELFED